jgi:hypothetical protein
MKTAIKEVWRRDPALRRQLGHAYLHLSHFQDGIGNEVLDCKLPGGAVAAAAANDLEAVRHHAAD